MRSTRIQRPNGTVLFETGPHTLRMSKSALPTYELVEQLNLQPSVILAKEAETTINIKYRGRIESLSINRESPFFSVLSSKWITNSLYRKSIPGLLKLASALLTRRTRQGLQDESIASWFRRRSNNHFTDVFVSAFVHGVYAGDIEQLSVRSTAFGRVWKAAEDPNQAFRPPPVEDAFLAEIKRGLRSDYFERNEKRRVFSFRDGIEELSTRLSDKLQGRVEIRTDCPVQSIQAPPSPTAPIKLRTPLQTQKFSHIISTVPIPKLFQVIPSAPADLANSFPPAVTVGVVNLYYAGDSVTLPLQGFGYLIPKSSLIENPESALGVLLISDVISGQDTGAFAKGGVKLTVMMGGHYWKDRSSYPSDDELLSSAKSLVEKDLGIGIEPTISQVNLQRNCIPQYQVGHHKCVAQLERYLDSTFGKERLKVVGSPINGVGINDCIGAARKAASRLKKLSIASG